MRPVADVLGDLNEMIWDAFPKEWRKAYDRRRYKAEALARIKRNSLPWMEGDGKPGTVPANPLGNQGQR
jgi:hypothetical protein